MIFRPLLVLLLLCLSMTGCHNDASTPTSPPQPENSAAQTKTVVFPSSQPEPLATYFPLAVGEREAQVQLALTPKERETGLMYRDRMGEHQGMIFVFPQAEARRFWMRNTYIPLDIAYIRPDGVIAEIHAMQPLDESGTPSRSRDIQFALEMNQGWFEAYQIKPGDAIDLNQLATAMEARGFEPPFAFPSPQ